MKILLTGGSGRLGQEIQKYTKCIAPSQQELNITKQINKTPVDFVIHAAAYTDVIKAEVERDKCFAVNVLGTLNLVQTYFNTRFIYISSEYANKPQNFYSWTKLWGEEMVQKHPNHLIIRTSFVVSPFPHEDAFIDQYTQGDYVSIIASLILKEIIKGTTGLIYIGTGRKTMFELARKTIPDIKGISVDDIKIVNLPKDYE
jgi:dTDP-4-dehydrorhamnose reductase